jgi:hypothetical protein
MFNQSWILCNSALTDRLNNKQLFVFKMKAHFSLEDYYVGILVLGYYHALKINVKQLDKKS